MREDDAIRTGADSFVKSMYSEWLFDNDLTRIPTDRYPRLRDMTQLFPSPLQAPDEHRPMTRGGAVVISVAQETAF